MPNIKNEIARYHSGQMTAAEMHALESRALSDPFLADALEGTAPLSTMELNDDVTELEARLNDRIQEKKTFIISPWTWPLRIAAGLLVLISATVVIISVQQKEPTGNIALNEPKQFAPPALREAAPSEDSADNSDKKISAVTESPGEPSEKKDVNPNTTEPARIESNTSEDAATPKELADASPAASAQGRSKDAFVTPERDATGKVEAEEAEKSIAQASPQSDDLSGARPSSSIKMDDRELRKGKISKASDANVGNAIALVLKGKVTAEDGAPLAGVNINIKGTSIGTVTDISGNYQLNVQENDPTLVFAFIGYAAEEIKADNVKGDLDVRLADDLTQLSEVVVTGYGVERDATEENSTVEFAAPNGGKKAYKQYLEKNLRYPKAAADAKIEGRVTIQFAVETTGKLSDFKVIKGLGNGCDEEVIRLIKAGPKWSPSKHDSTPVREMVKVRMKFQLPKK